MKRNDITQLHQMTLAELQQKLEEANKSLSKAQIERAAAKLTNHRLVATLKKDIARIKTIMTEKQNSPSTDEKK